MRVAISRPAKKQVPAPTGSAVTVTRNFPAPTKGWIRNQNLAMGGAESLGAYVLDNWFPGTDRIRLRKGSKRVATIGAGLPVGAIMPYQNGSNVKLFAANETAIYDITSPASPNASPAPVVSGLTGRDFVYEQFSNAGGTYLIAVNGQNPRQIFNGATWVTTPAITGVLSESLSAVWSFKNQLFFVQKGALDAWYLAPDAIGGAAVRFPLGGVFKRGGALLFGCTWSIESAGQGLADRCVFVSTEGEVAIYSGTTPASPDWALDGVYRIGRPLGVRSWVKAGGDVVICTDIGFVPLSQALSRDVAALGGAAVSYPIEEPWKEEVESRGSSLPWSVEFWPSEYMAIIGLPSFNNLEKIAFVVNLRTGAWARYTGWSIRCMGLFGSQLYFGDEQGRIFEAESTGYDDGVNPYTGRLVTMFDHIGSQSNFKKAVLARANFLSVLKPERRLEAHSNYSLSDYSDPSASPGVQVSIWGTGIWGTFRWGQLSARSFFSDWGAVSASGISLAVEARCTSADLAEPRIDLVSIDLQAETGSVIG